MNHGACMEVFGAEKSQASAMEVLEKRQLDCRVCGRQHTINLCCCGHPAPCTVLYPQFCVQALCGFDGSSCGVKYASFAAFAPAVLDTDAARPAFLQQLAERRRRVIGGMSCPGLRDECYACLYGCSQAGVLGPRDIEAAIMDTGGDAGRALAWYPGLLMAWWFAKADTFFRENQLPAYYGEIDSIRSVVCSFSSAAVWPCAACLALNRNHQLKRSADAASLRVAATQRVATDPSVIVPFRSAEGLERAGHVELFERLKVVTSALIAERADRIVLDREIKRRTSLFQADRVRLQAYARADASRSEPVRLLETSQRGMMQCRHARQLINPRKMMMIGPYLISFPALRALSKRMPHVNISSQDLNYKDKQNQRATLK
ncbi:hypothetical protein VOLCADRAFT_107744 [Volvox carteri f. nagariensis]|uniref:Uncharacterized protein n=1 Tax=Volvox carteri f. nagariensis TaxID=3068 RepID=D8UG10_VOLCA|nr:uncharacterized protein VOLCADRAFT_107744 [Volvox carteri f. nagariensis]EFJ41370.1 hypothetical protein VOLCADRAFT_107744 [Volvox carteri f. nagariensis]|eukprot:XP_002957600.1 hypothetical protein VOLCADRAFT_107744 [Volvox carteri f. nagariensis]